MGMKAPEGMKLCAVRKKVAGYDFLIASGLKERKEEKPILLYFLQLNICR
jgi:hypothetical protein